MKRAYPLIGIAALTILAMNCAPMLPPDGSILPNDLRLIGSVSIIKWVAQGQAIAGVEEQYPDLAIMLEKQRFYIACQYLPKDALKDIDKRIIRIKESQIKKVQLDGTNDILELTILSNKPDEVVIQLDNTFGNMGAHGYRFVFKRVNDTITASAELQYVS
jgi:hypothetical protein